MKYAVFVLAALVSVSVFAKGDKNKDEGVAFYDLNNKRHVIKEKPATNYAHLYCDVYVLDTMSNRTSLSKANRDEAKKHHAEILKIDKPATAKAFTARYGKLPNGSIKQLETNLLKMQDNVMKDMDKRGYSMEELPKFIDVCYSHAKMLGKFYKE